jgi:hypothetical protein
MHQPMLAHPACTRKAQSDDKHASLCCQLGCKPNWLPIGAMVHDQDVLEL